MLLEPTLFGLGCSVSILCAIVTSDDDRIGAALLLTIGWAASNCAWAADGVQYLPVLDLALTCWFFSAWRLRQSRWLHALWMLGFAQLLAHIARDAAEWLTGDTYYTAYAWALNLTFAAQLAVVSKSGAKDVLTDLLCSFRRLGGQAPLRVEKKEVAR